MSDLRGKRSCRLSVCYLYVCAAINGTLRNKGRVAYSIRYLVFYRNTLYDAYQYRHLVAINHNYAIAESVTKYYFHREIEIGSLRMKIYSLFGSYSYEFLSWRLFILTSRSRYKHAEQIRDKAGERISVSYVGLPRRISNSQNKLAWVLRHTTKEPCVFRQPVTASSLNYYRLIGCLFSSLPGQNRFNPARFPEWFVVWRFREWGSNRKLPVWRRIIGIRICG